MLSRLSLQDLRARGRTQTRIKRQENTSSEKNMKRTNKKLDRFFNSKSIVVIKSLKDITSMNNKSIALICSPASNHADDIKITIKDR